MSEKIISSRQRQKCDLKANWETNNPVLLLGEIGVETDTNMIKIGDGTTAWNSLGYIGSSEEITIDSELSNTSENPVQNKVITEAVEEINEKIENISSGGSNPNILINGDFAINQRGESSYSGSSAFTVDRWMQEVGTVTPTDTGVNVYCSSGTSGIVLAQYIENFEQFRGKTVCCSIKFKISQSATIRLIVEDNAYCNTTANLSANSTYYYITHPISENASYLKVYMQVRNAPSGCDFDVEFIKLEVGSVATEFIPRPYGEELALCQRYFVKINASEANSFFGFGMRFVTDKVLISIPLQTQLARTPTYTASDVAYIYSEGYAYLIDTVTVEKSTTTNVVLGITSPTDFSEHSCFGLMASSSESFITFDAEIY